MGGLCFYIGGSRAYATQILKNKSCHLEGGGKNLYFSQTVDVNDLSGKELGH